MTIYDVKADEFLAEINSYHGYPFDLVVNLSKGVPNWHEYINHQQVYAYYQEGYVKLVAKKRFVIYGASGFWRLYLREFETHCDRYNTIFESSAYRTRKQLIEAYCNGNI